MPASIRNGRWLGTLGPNQVKTHEEMPRSYESDLGPLGPRGVFLADMRTTLAFLSVLILTGCGFRGMMRQGRPIQAPARSTVQVEYERNLLFSTVEVNGVRKRFAFDTGAPCVISPALKEELGLRTIARHGVRDSQGRAQQLEFVKLKELQVGQVVFKNMIAVVSDLSQVKCYEMDGLLGANALRHLDWRFDLQAEEATAYNADVLKSMRTEGNFSIDFEPNIQHTPVVEIMIDGMKSSVTASLDMGSTGSVTLKGEIKELAELHEHRSWVHGRTSRGIYGTLVDTTHYFIADSIEIGGRSFTDQFVKGGNSNLLGNSFLEPFDFLLSYRHDKILLSPKPKKATELPATKIVIGEDRDSLRVMGIREAGKDLPLDVDDVILSINGEDMSTLSEMELCELYKRDWQVLDMRILRPDGSIIELELPREEVFRSSR